MNGTKLLDLIGRGEGLDLESKSAREVSQKVPRARFPFELSAIS